MTKHVVVALSADKVAVTFYTQMGETVSLKQGDSRLDTIMDIVREPLSNNEPVLVDFSHDVNLEKSEWADVERKTSGLIKFFRVARSKLDEFLGNKKSTTYVSSFISPQDLGKIPGSESYSENGHISHNPKIPKEESKPEPVKVQEEVDLKPLLVVTGISASRVAAIKALRTLTGMDLLDAIRVYESVSFPVTIPFGMLSKDTLEEDIQKACTDGVSVTVFTKAELDAYISQMEKAAIEKYEAEKTKPVELSDDEKLDIAKERLHALTARAPTPENASFHNPVKEDETVIAVTATGAVVPDIHKIQAHVRHANKLSDFTGFQKFLTRVSAIIADRRHSMEDLMNFLSTADLPIADNGDIIIFKRLRRINESHPLKRGDMKADYVDCHSGNVGQRVGSLVYMDASRVDPNRSSSCSVGLHVATLGYLSSFGGDVTIIGAVRPEDVITVPHREHTKVRVSAYRILAELPDDLRDHVNSGKSLSDSEVGANLLHKAITGAFPEPNQHVYITGNQGASVTYKDLDQVGAVEASEATGLAETVKPLGTPLVHKSKDVSVDSMKRPEKPKAKAKAKTSKKVTPKAKGKPATKGKKSKMSNLEIAAQMWASFNEVKKTNNRSEIIDAARELQSFKTRTKKGWTALGLPADAGEKLKLWL